MKSSAGPRWYNAALIIGVSYFAIAVTTGALAAMAESDRAQFLWRLSAFFLSGLLFLFHIAYEHFRLPSSPKSIACHTSIAVAIGALALAASANLNEVISASGFRLRMLLALLLWPLLTAIPAFVIAFVLAVIIRKLRPQNSRR